MKRSTQSVALAIILVGFTLVGCATAAGTDAVADDSDAAGRPAPQSSDQPVDLTVFPTPDEGDADLVTPRAEGRFSLAKLGPAVDAGVDSAFQSADYYTAIGSYDRAARVLNYGLYLAGELNIELALLQFDQMLLLRAYALADSQRQEQAIDVYDFREDVILDQNDWANRLPPGLTVDRDVPNEELTEFRAILYQDRAISLTALGRFDEAWNDVERSVQNSLEMDDPERAAWTYQAFMINAVNMEEWDAVLQAYGPASALSAEFPSAVSTEQLLSFLRLEAIANFNLGNYRAAYNGIEGVLRQKDRTGFEDGYSNYDRQLRDAALQLAGAQAADEDDESLVSRVRDSDVRAVRSLLQDGVDPDETDSIDGRTPLMYAVLSSTEPAIVELLLEAGANVNARDNETWTPLMLAAHNNPNPEIVRILIEAGAELEPEGAFVGATPLSLAAGYTENYTVVEELLAAGADPNAQSDAGWSSLMIVARYPSGEQMTEILLDAGADPNLKTTDGVTALQAALDSGNSNIAAMLREAGARE
jgi:hypothetical protein